MLYTYIYMYIYTYMRKLMISGNLRIKRLIREFWRALLRWLY